jgi:type III restriction enzyme
LVAPDRQALAILKQRTNDHGFLAFQPTRAITPGVPPAIIDNPILNSPYIGPGRHWVLDENGIPTGVHAEGRRRSEFIVPVPPSRHKTKTQGDLDLEDEYGQRKSNDYINEIRAKVDAWRSLGDAGLRRTVTPVTARLLKH